ncbi:ATP-dependent RNA helicase HrpA [Rudaea sp.]|uniref:ATP-dependent RNA helicase HrpA n=1 Tax=Rudaea sp. TaxID=2136325 RepID=UPI003220082F
MSALRGELAATMLRDRRALAREIDRLASRAPDEAALARLRARVAQARERIAARAASVPEIRVDESLPIAARADEIVELIRGHQVVVVAGETGSGKSTQLPKLCLAAGRGRAGLIGCTQPRRVAARSVARRVADELGTESGGLVGYQVRFAEQAGERTLVKFMTDGILLAETQGDAWLNAYDTIIIDEAHERSLNIDFLLGYLKRLLARRKDLKLIVTSATIDTARFAAHFGNAPVVEVEGRSYPVEVRWRPPAGDSATAGRDRSSSASERNIPTQVEQILAAVDEITREDPRGDALIFLSGEREIRDTHLALTRRNHRATEVLALYARLSAAEQDRVFKPGPQRRIVLATNVAETSLTVPRIRYVIDTGTARVKRYSPRNQLERLHVEPISQAAAEQRKGRCGRVGPGVCLRLYAEDDFNARPKYSDPEILRSSLAGVILRMLSLKLGEVEDFPFVEAPNPRAIGDGWRRLGELGAVDEEKRLTDIGQRMSTLPIDVALARMLVEAQRLGVSRELLILVAFLSIQDPRERPPDARQAADAAQAQFVDAKSDFIGVLNLWQAHALAHEDLTQSKLRDWCGARFLSYLRMREWRELHRQLLLMDEPGPDARTKVPEQPKVKAGRQAASSAAESELQKAGAANYEAVHRSLLSGWPTQVALKDEKNQYRGTRERRYQIFPGSALAKKPPRWLLSGQILDLQKVYAMLNAEVAPEWIEQQAAHLVKRSWREPHWSRKRGAVLAFEQVTLFGLTLVEKRSVQFGTQNPEEAHEVFLREALARCDIDCRADCVRANARVLEQAQEIEAKQRRSGLVRDEDELVAFLRGKLPMEISTAAAFDAWYRRASAAEQAALRWSLDDVLSNQPGLRASDFPTQLDCAGHKLKLDYRFVPGDAADGVTLQVPLAFVNAVPARRCEWLVPGLLPDKVAELIRGLPKALRRNFVPAPDFARAFAEAEPPRDAPLLDALAAYLRRVTGVEIAAGDFAGIELPAHFSMRFRVYDEHGKTLAEGRDIEAIRDAWGGAANAAFSRRADVELAREEVAEFDFEDIPERIVSAGNLVAWPALVDLGASVALRVFERADEARDAHVQGVRRLLRRALQEKIKQARRQLPIERRLALKYAGIASVDELREDIVEAALNELLDARTHAVGPRGARGLDLRQRVAFREAEAEIGGHLFATAVDLLKLVEEVLAAYAEFTPWLEPPLIGYAKANYDDLREQLAELVHPGFVQKVEKSRLQHFPRYLKAMRLRAERLRQDATRDQARMLTVRGYWREYLQRKASGDADPARLAELRWLIEELRVSLFAQELKTAEPVSPKRLNRLVEELG